ncbi:MAG TPA: HAD-IIA family hydrolase [Actinomycetota bacterium]|nr:HAD-IIA family hydrolase [Actinomycetota bacterium]
MNATPAGDRRPAGGDSGEPRGDRRELLVDEYDALLFDLDGVLYRATETVEGAPEAVARARERGASIAFVTNNSSRTPDQVAEKLRGHGIDARTEEVVTSAMALADLLRADDELGGAGGRTAFVVGEEGISEALREAGFELVDEDAGRADVVAVGVDTHVTYARLRTAALLVQRGARLVATNTDASYPAPDGLWPGAGAMLAVITTTLGRDADVVAGKPHAPLLRSALERSGGQRPLVVGDRLDTDIDGAAGVGWDSLMVLTGISQPRDLLEAPNLPTHLGADLGALFRPATTVRPATGADAESVERLLRESGLQTDGVAGRAPLTLVAERDDGGVVGTVALEVFESAGDTIAHLRSLAVAEGQRGERTGVLLTAHAVHLARTRGAIRVHAVTETAARFFDALGFQRTGARDSLPDPIRRTPMVRDFCAESSVAFVWAPPN